MSQDLFAHLLALASDACERGDQTLATNLARVVDEVELALLPCAGSSTTDAAMDDSARTGLSPLDLPVVVARRAAYLHRIAHAQGDVVHARAQKALSRAWPERSAQVFGPVVGTEESVAPAG